jgi:hypothetical protein
MFTHNLQQSWKAIRPQDARQAQPAASDTTVSILDARTKTAESEVHTVKSEVRTSILYHYGRSTGP